MNYTWQNDVQKQNALTQTYNTLAKANLNRYRAKAAIGTFKNVYPNVSVRDGMSRSDYELFRPNERLPTQPKEIMAAGQQAYERFPMVRSAIDTMADFGSRGARPIHPDKTINKFYKSWWKLVRGSNRCERMLSMAYRKANIPMHRAFMKMNAVNVQRLRRAVADTSLKVDFDFDYGRKTIPIQYKIMDPCSITPVFGELGAFIDENFYQLDLPPRLVSMIKNPRNDAERNIVSKIPTDIIESMGQGMNGVPLNPERFQMLFFKKDDSELWATPILYCILRDLIQLDKMELADSAALDGIMSSIRIWSLGDLEHQVLPGEAINMLSEILDNNVGGGTFDLVWGPDIKLFETSTNAHNFLGSEKYGPVMSRIYEGLGMSPTITGRSSSAGFTNNFIQLKVLVERLQSGRELLKEFWEGEFKIVQEAMGWRKPAELIFEHMNLSDEAAEKALWVQLLDRNVVTEESVRERFGMIPEIEMARQRRQDRLRMAKKIPPKASPFHDANSDIGYKKILVQRGVVAPSQVGVELEPMKPGEKSMIQPLLPPTAVPNKKPGGVPGQGRPTNKKDSSKRKPKRVTPKTKAELLRHYASWAQSVQSMISRVVNAAYIKSLGKNLLRDLTKDELYKLEHFKFAVLYNMPDDIVISPFAISEIIQKPMNTDNIAHANLDNLIEVMRKKGKRKIRVSDLQSAKSLLYATLKLADEVE